MLTSILRTIIPALWGSFITFVLSIVPVLEPLRAELLQYADLAVPVISAVIIGAWYALWRKLEPRLPDWLTRILLGSAQAPVYPKDAILGQTDQASEALVDWHETTRGTLGNRSPIYADDNTDE